MLKQSHPFGETTAAVPPHLTGNPHHGVCYLMTSIVIGLIVTVIVAWIVVANIETYLVTKERDERMKENN